MIDETTPAVSYRLFTDKPSQAVMLLWILTQIKVWEKPGGGIF